jgi:circadian clock protein KaiC
MRLWDWGDKLTLHRFGKKADMSRRANKLNGLEKCPTGIKGLDEITEGGLPRGRCTLVCGSAGCGKTLLGMEFLIRGITEFKEPGVLMAFEETAEELAKNVASLGFDVPRLLRNKQMAIDSVHIERSEIQETGDYNLDGLFIRLNLMMESVGARRVVLDTVEALLGGIPNEAIMRAELRRLFRWLKDKGVTAVITGEQGEKSLTRYGLEEYVSDCVIFLDHQVQGPMATRRLRIVKYRGSRHGTNNYPTLIDRNGLWVLPISSLGLSYPVSHQRVSTGVARLDAMLDGKGYFKGTSVLISGMAGTGKSSLRRRCMPSRGARDVLLVRGITGPDHSEHEFNWFRFEEVDAQRIATIPFAASHGVRAGDAPGQHSQTGEGIQTRGGCDGPDHEPDQRRIE